MCEGCWGEWRGHQLYCHLYLVCVGGRGLKNISGGWRGGHKNLGDSIKMYPTLPHVVINDSSLSDLSLFIASPTIWGIEFHKHILKFSVPLVLLFRIRMVFVFLLYVSNFVNIFQFVCFFPIWFRNSDWSL